MRNLLGIWQRPARPPAGWQRVKRVAAWFGAGCLSVTLGVIVGFYIWAPGVVRQFGAVLEQTQDNTIIYDRNEKILATVQGVEDRHQVALAWTSPYLQKAVVAIEDRRFFGHRGMDPIRLIGAIWADLQSMAFQQGGSTITQQLVKLTLLSSERTLERKIKEIFMALALEREFSKEKILETYLNQVYLGFGVYGVEKAAQSYFQHSAASLSLSEAAFLAALIKKPEGYLTGAKVIEQDGAALLQFEPDSPLMQRHALVLNTLRQLGWVSAEDRAAAESEPLVVYRPKDETSGAPYFVQEVLKEMRDRLGIVRVSGRGLRVFTTLDPLMQNTAQELVSKLKEGRFSASQGALVAMDPATGEVRALVGGVDYADSQFNRATQARRQPGSAFKPILYAAAFEQGYAANSVFLDEPVRYSWALDDGSEEMYEPRNYGERYGVVRDDGDALLPHDHRMTLGRALEVSSNVVAVKLLHEMGVGPVRRLAGLLGIDMRSRMGLCLALGCSEVTLLELTSAYASFANGGLRARPVLIRWIENGEGRVQFENRPNLPEQVISPWTAFVTNQLLQGVVQRGTGWRARLDRPTGGKTGTNDGPRDTWFVGFTPTLVAGVWTGNDDNSVMPFEVGGRTAAKLWREFMERVLEPYRGEMFPEPEDSYVAVRICTVSGEAAGPWCPHTELSYFRQGEAPQTVCSVHGGPPVAHATCADSGELITPYCPVESRQYRYFYPNRLPSKPCPVHSPGAGGQLVNGAAPADGTSYARAAGAPLDGAVAEGDPPRRNEAGLGRNLRVSPAPLPRRADYARELDEAFDPVEENLDAAPAPRAAPAALETQPPEPSPLTPNP